MSFKLLKEIIAAFKQKSSCPFCKSKFSDESIFVLATNMTPPTCVGGGNGLFFVVCPKCTAHSFVMMEITNPNNQNQGVSISTNEVLDMHNFLKEWQGDVKELFQEQ